MKLELVAKFEGDQAESHSLPAYPAVQSIYGVARANLVAINFLAEGRVRRKGFDAKGYDLILKSQRPGSFETVFELVLRPESMAYGAAILGGVGGNFATDFLKTIFRRTIGRQTNNRIDQMEAKGELNPGDIAALVDAVTPALKSAHKSIDAGANVINININGDNNIVSFDDRSKAFLNDFSIDNTVRAKEFSIGSFNANSGEGKAFDYDLGHLVTFDLATNIDRQSVNLITDSISKYAQRKFEDLNSRVAVRYTSINSLDGRIKKMRFHQVSSNLSELSSSPYRPIGR